uniref:Small ribosomal subunit protein uS13c n=1 Tax=Pterocladiophila hemisphaerica TaxID=2712948 RepID=A0A6M3WWT0_9FLOR|nr:ribosomal protein S13 [Pterocladiophila hemisphaerica]
MINIAGVLLSSKKQIFISLTAIYGISQKTSYDILHQECIPPSKLTKELTIQEIIKIKQNIQQNYSVENDLKKIIKTHILRLKKINTYKGKRHKQSLPVRGQRTKTNAKTAKNKNK